MESSRAREVGVQVYYGRVFHKRNRTEKVPVTNTLRYNIFMTLLDIDQVEQQGFSSSLWNSTRNVLFYFMASWKRKDYFDLGDENESLASCVRRLVYMRSGITLSEDAPICMLTNLRFFGYGFNPVSIYYCFKDNTKRELDAVMLEVSNTPWLEKRFYVLPFKDQAPSSKNCFSEDLLSYHYRWIKDFHVSPFMDLLHEYSWDLSIPDEKELHVRAVSFEREPIEKENLSSANDNKVHSTRDAPTIPVLEELNISNGEGKNKKKQKVTFVVGLHLSKLEMKSLRAYGLLIWQPILTCMILLWIHIHAFKVWYKGVAYVTPPSNSPRLGLGDAVKHLIIFFFAFLWSMVQYILFPIAWIASTLVTIFIK